MVVQQQQQVLDVVPLRPPVQQLHEQREQRQEHEHRARNVVDDGFEHRLAAIRFRLGAYLAQLLVARIRFRIGLFEALANLREDV